MQVFIDGYNAIFSSPIAEINLEEARRQFLESLENTKHLPKKTIIVFDAKNLHFSKINVGTLVVVYTAKNQSADTYILEQIELAKQKGQILVVSNDRGLKQKAKMLGAKTQNFHKFYQALEKKQVKREEKPKPRSHDVKHYLKIFEKKSKK